MQHERREQRDIVEFHGRLVIDPLSAILFAVPNGEKRDKATAGMLSGRRWRDDLAPQTDAEAMRPWGQGVLAGAPDLILLTAPARVTLIEVKLGKTLLHGKTGLTGNQPRFSRCSRALGHDYRIIRGPEEYQALLLELGVRLRIHCVWPTPAPPVPLVALSGQTKAVSGRPRARTTPQPLALARSRTAASK